MEFWFSEFHKMCIRDRIAGIVLGSIAGVTAKVVGVGILTDTQKELVSVRASHAALAASHWASVSSLRSFT